MKKILTFFVSLLVLTTAFTINVKANDPTPAQSFMEGFVGLGYGNGTTGYYKAETINFDEQDNITSVFISYSGDGQSYGESIEYTVANGDIFDASVNKTGGNVTSIDFSYKIDDYKYIEYSISKDQSNFNVSANFKLFKGLYFCNDPFAELDVDNLDNFSKENQITLYSSNSILVVYYDGENFTELTNANLDYSGLTNFEIGKELIGNGGGQYKTVTSLKPNEIGTFTINGKNNYASYSLTVKSELPIFGLYSTPTGDASASDYVNNICLYPDGTKFYVKSTDANQVFSSISKVSYPKEQGNIDLPTNNYSINGNEISFKKLSDINDINIEITKTDSYTHEIYVKNMLSMPSVLYEDVSYDFGFSESSDDNNLTLTNGAEYRIENEQIDSTWYLLAGNVSGAFALVAPNEIYDGISNFEVSLVRNAFKDGDITITKHTSKSYQFERNVYGFDISIKANATGEAYVKGEFDLTIDDITSHYVTYRYLSVVDRSPVTVTFNATDMTNFNDIFTNCGTFMNWLEGNPTKLEGLNGRKVDEVRDFIIKLPEGIYNNKFIVNIEDYNEDFPGEHTILFSGNQKEIEDELVNNTTIKGEFKIVGGYADLENINFEKDDDITDSVDGINNKTIGILACKGNTGCSGISHIYNCNFKGYDYGLLASKSGVIGDLSSCTIEDCDYGYYMDNDGLFAASAGSGSEGNLFLNNKTAAVVIISCPMNNPGYGLRFSENTFISNNGSYDFYIGEEMVGEKNGILYFQKNYYGKILEDFDELSNVRSVRVYKESNETIVFTNPCVRYVNSEYPLGIDPTDGVQTRIFSGVGIVINKLDLNNISTLSVSSPDGSVEYGRFEFGD